jgi:hypothetical protein
MSNLFVAMKHTSLSSALRKGHFLIQRSELIVRRFNHHHLCFTVEVYGFWVPSYLITLGLPSITIAVELLGPISWYIH